MSTVAPVTSQKADAQPPVYAPSSTPTVRRFFRRWSFWVGAAVVVVVASLLLLLLRGGGGSADTSALSITSAAPGGSKALAEVLRKQGVTVTAADSLIAAETAVTDAKKAGSLQPTVLIYDPDEYLPGDRYGEVAGLGARIVLVQPDAFELEGVAPTVSLAGAPSGAADNSSTATADCSLPAAARAGSITVSGTTYRLTGSGSSSGVRSSDSSSCFATGDNAYSLVRTTAGPVPVTVLGAPDVLSNEQIVTAGNAALALGLLGQSSSLVWYIPSAADVTATGAGPPSLGELTPGWVTPVILLLILVFIAAAVWRGRRLGPVVIENLPVIVRGNETVTGRARLYARSAARTRALDALRIGTSGRLARMLGLSRRANLDEIVLATATATGIAPAEVAAILVNRLPATEAELLALSQNLADLEAAVRRSVYGGTGSTGSAGSTGSTGSAGSAGGSPPPGSL